MLKLPKKPKKRSIGTILLPEPLADWLEETIAANPDSRFKKTDVIEMALEMLKASAESSEEGSKTAQSSEMTNPTGQYGRSYNSHTAA